VKRTYLIIIVTVISYICTRLFFFDNTTPVSKELTLKNVSVVIDPGHGGLDNGASVGNIYESDLNLKISFALKEELENRGAKVYMTRTDDQDMTRRDHHYSKQDDMYLRVKKIDEYECDYLISIHLNSTPSTSAWGSQVFYYQNSEKGKRLASEIQSSMKEVTGSPKRISGASFRVLRATKTLGVLIECGFISNPNERGQLQSSKYHQKLAIKICDGLENYRKKYPEDTIDLNELKKVLE
jgi:hypothetical protein